MKLSTRKNQEGMAMVVAVIFVSVALVLLGAMSHRMLNQNRQTTNFENYRSLILGLDAGLTQSKVELMDGEDGAIGLGDWVPEFDENGLPIKPEVSDVEPQSLDETSDVRYIAYAQNWITDGFDNDGDGVVDGLSENGKYTLHAWAGNNNAVRRVEMVLDSDDVNVWRNAIFAGSGQAGGLINGNVSIHGSVHLLGNNLSEGDAAIAAIDISGTSLIHNNYNGVPADLLNRVPALATTTIDGDEVETLEGKLRVKKGLVGMSGNSEIGEIYVSGDAYKESMDGTFVNDGWTGNDVIDDGDRGDPQSVYSDNGWDEGYDVGNYVSMPFLTDDWRDPVDGSKVADPETGTWYTHDDYFNEVLLADPADQTDGRYVGDIILNVADKNGDFYWNATQNIESKSVPATAPDPGDDYIIFDATANTLEINGQITIDGNLSFLGKGNDTTINYSGRAALLVNGDVAIDTNLLSCNNGDPNDTTLSFPVDNIIGVMARDNMIVGSTAQLSIMGAFYAQGQISCSKQTSVMGTFVSNYFDMGTNVPNIYQVPTLADNLPHGMIGNFPIMTFEEIVWREVGHVI